MADTLPYLASPGSIKTAFERIRAAAAPDRVTTDFVQTKLQMKGGTGAAVLPFLKKIGFVAPDGSPTPLYKEFRNASTGGRAVSEAIKIGYKPLSAVNEYFYELGDNELLDLIVQVTEAQKTAPSSKLTLSTLKTLKGFANFDAAPEPSSATEVATQIGPTKLPIISGQVGLNLSYTINLNLPATADQAVFNAIFRSLREHLIPNDQE